MFTALTIRRVSAIIHLTRGMHTVVDVADWAWLMQVGPWNASPSGPGAVNKYYARAKIKGRHVLMHKLIVGGREEIDHEDRNRLNNRRTNLRAASHSLNMVNAIRTNSTGFRGVRRQRSGGYQASIKGRGLGTFMTPEAAALAYDTAAISEYGGFAVLNFDGSRA